MTQMRGFSGVRSTTHILATGRQCNVEGAPQDGVATQDITNSMSEVTNGEERLDIAERDGHVFCYSRNRRTIGIWSSRAEDGRLHFQLSNSRRSIADFEYPKAMTCDFRALCYTDSFVLISLFYRSMRRMVYLHNRYNNPRRVV